MKVIQKFAPAIVWFIVLGSLFITGCNSHQSSSESIETITEEDTPDCELNAEPLESKPLTLFIKNLPSADAPVIVVVYGTKNKFPDPKDKLKRYKFKPDGKELKMEINNLRFGAYALVVYQDENSNGKIDKNFMGIPKEGYGFSNNFKPTIRAPKFEECKFDYNETTNTVTVSIL